MTRHLLKLIWNRKRANALVMMEIFLSFLVLFAVLSFAFSAIGRWNDPLGYDWHNVWIVQLNVAGHEPGESDEFKPTLDRLLRETKAFKEIEAASLSDTPPYMMSTNSGVWVIDGKKVRITRDDATDGFADVMRMRVLRGRWFSREDDGLSYVPVVIDSDLAKAFYAGKEPIGQKFDSDGTTESRVVGVIPPYRKDGETSSSEMNMAFTRVSLVTPKGRAPRNMVIRVQPGTGADFEEKLVRRLHEVVPEVPFTLTRMDRARSFSLRLHLVPLILSSIVAFFLMSMVALGLTGVLWQSVTRRTRELGLRRAVGASGSVVRKQVLIEVALIATLAVIVGLVVILQLPLLGIFTAITPLVFTLGILAALAAIYTITLVSALYPSWLASRLMPAEALRYE